jgi:hypothetical protein
MLANKKPTLKIIYLRVGFFILLSSKRLLLLTTIEKIEWIGAEGT